MHHIVAILAAWFLAYLFMTQDGLFGFLWRIRELSAWLDRKGLSTLYNILHCIYCSATWTALLVSSLLYWGDWNTLIVYAFGYAAGAVILDYIHEKLQGW